MPRWFATLLLLTCISGTGALAGSAIQAQAGNGRQETKDRLTPEAMERLVTRPMARVRAGDAAGGERAFEALYADTVRRHGPGSAQASDLLMAFGVTLYSEWQTPSTGAEADETLRVRAVPYLRRSVDAYRAAFGADHPLVALALHSLADAMTDLAPDDPPAEAETALEEAYRIRRAALGRSNPETLAALRGLAHIRGLPSRIGRDSTRLAAVAAMYREGLAQATRPLSQFPEEQPRYWYGRLAGLYARNGQATAALQVVREAERASGAWPCTDMSILRAEVANLLDRQGFTTEAEALTARDPIDEAMACLDRRDEPVVPTA